MQLPDPLRARWLLAAALLALLAPSAARAAGVVVLTDSRVPQYGEASRAARAEMPPIAGELDVQIPEAGSRLRQLKPDVALATGQKALDLARAVMPELPVVYAMVLEKNVSESPYATGVALDLDATGQLARLKRVYPGLKRLAVLYDPRASDALAQAAVRDGRELGVHVALKPVSDPKEVQPTLTGLEGTADALWLLPDPRLITRDVFSYLLVYTLERKIAVFGFLDSFTQAGALASISPDYAEIGREAGKLAAQVLARPADKRLPLPPARRTRGGLSVNQRAAERLGIDIPAATLQSAQHVHK